MNDGFGQAPKKKETVFNGPTPGMDNKAFAMTSVPGATGTVYNGPAPGGTVYGGPSREPAAAGTVFDESKFVARKADASVAIKATTTRVRATAIGFFIVAGISLLEAIFFWSSDPPFAIASAIICGMFTVIGIFTYRLSRVALLTAIALYLIDTLLLLFQAFFGDGLLVTSLLPIAIHCFILYRLWMTYGQLEELHSLAD